MKYHERMGAISDMFGQSIRVCPEVTTPFHLHSCSSLSQQIRCLSRDPFVTPLNWNTIIYIPFINGSTVWCFDRKITGWVLKPKSCVPHPVLLVRCFVGHGRPWWSFSGSGKAPRSCAEFTRSESGCEYLWCLLGILISWLVVSNMFICA